MPANEVKLRNGSEEKTIEMHRPPRVGSYITVGGEKWQVLSVSYTIPYRTQKARILSLVKNDEVA